MNIEKLNATITSSKVALSLTILTFDYKVAFSFSIGDEEKTMQNHFKFLPIIVAFFLSHISI